MNKHDMLMSMALDDGDKIYHIINGDNPITDEMLYDYDDHLLVSNYWYFKNMGIDDGRILPIVCMSGKDIQSLFKANLSTISFKVVSYTSGKYITKDISSLKSDEYYSFIKLFDSDSIGFIKIHIDDSYFCDMANTLNSYYIGLDGTFKPNIELNKMLDNDDRMIKAWKGYDKGKDFLDIMHFSDILDYIDIDFAYQYGFDICMNSDYEMKHILKKSYDENKVHDILHSQYLLNKAVTECKKVITKLQNYVSYITPNSITIHETLLDIMNSYYHDDIINSIFAYDEMYKELAKLVLCDENGTYIDKRPNITNIKNDKKLIKEVLRLYKLLIQNKGGC